LAQAAEKMGITPCEAQEVGGKARHDTIEIWDGRQLHKEA